MNGKERRAELRGAVFRGDDETLERILREQPWPDDALQLIGDGLLGALTRQAGNADELARDCVLALRARGWEGDEDLAEALDARLGTGPAPLLRPLPVDLEELADILEGDPVHGGGRIDLRTGEVWPQSSIEYAQEVGEEDEEESDDPDRWLWVDSEGSGAGYGDMALFIDDVDDPAAADRLDIAIQGRGAFRRFKDVLARWPDLQERWYAFSDDRHRGRARAWLAGEGYAAAPPQRTLP